MHRLLLVQDLGEALQNLTFPSHPHPFGQEREHSWCGIPPPHHTEEQRKHERRTKVSKRHTKYTRLGRTLKSTNQLWRSENVVLTFPGPQLSWTQLLAHPLNCARNKTNETRHYTPDGSRSAPYLIARYSLPPTSNTFLSNIRLNSNSTRL
jgi:hypothetical protein